MSDVGEGETGGDVARLGRLGKLLGEDCPGYKITFDMNEQFRDVEGVKAFWGACLEDAAAADLLSDRHLLFVEQPLHRDVARGLAALRVEGGAVGVGSVSAASFGCGIGWSDGMGEAGMP